ALVACVYALGIGSPLALAEPPPPEFPKTPEGKLDREALIREIREREKIPWVKAEHERLIKEATNEPRYRVSPVFGSERLFFKNLDSNQSAWGTLYRAFANGRYYLLAIGLGLVAFVVVANWVRWRRLERKYLGSSAPDTNGSTSEG